MTMRIRTPGYYTDFRCLMGDCPDTCCRDWEVVLDEQTKAFYESVPGALGDELRTAMEKGNGEYFELDHALCPFLNEAGLCRIQLACGEERLTHNCASFPRFAEEYGALREWALAISCPEAARLILTAENPADFVLEKTDEPLDGTNDLDAKLFFCLTAARQKLYALACDREFPFTDRLALIVVLAAAMEKKLDHGKYAAAQKIAERFDPRTECAKLKRYRKHDPKPSQALLELLRSMEILTPRYRGLLEAADAQTLCIAEHPAWENLLVYFLYRYVLKAAVDGDLFGRVRAAVCGVLAIRALLGASFSLERMIDVSHLYGREIEHAADNLSALVSAPLAKKQLLRAILQ